MLGFHISFIQFDKEYLDYDDLVVEMNKEGFIEIRHNTFIRNNTILNEEDIKFALSFKLDKEDEIFILEVMEKFKSMGIVERLYNLTSAFISVVKSHNRTKLKKECKKNKLSPMKETFKLLVSDVDNLGIYFGIGEVAYIKKLIVDKVQEIVYNKLEVERPLIF